MQLFRFFSLILITCFLSIGVFAQTLGGNSVYGFLRLPQGAQQSALGGENISQITKDISIAATNPALLRSNMSGQIHAGYHSFLAGINQYNLFTSNYLEKQQVNIGFGVHYLDYGSIQQTDIAGNIGGSFRPRDHMVQIAVSKAYKDRWNVGVSMQWIGAQMGQFRSSALAWNVGLAYLDTSTGLQLSFLAKNMGFQLQTFDGVREELPFDVQIGISKKLALAPIQFSLTAYRLQRWDLLYNDPAFNELEGDDRFLNKGLTLQRILSHLVVSTQFYPHEKLECTIGYNFLRRFDLNAFNQTNGLNGFTWGAGVLLKKLHFRYAGSAFQRNLAHQVSFSIPWNNKAL
ncbi:MAG: type IX secretion system protein PorQ [Hydrotalea sp.]|nr:type IX secretion system protein PorQ [Hydrotalea sp.]